MKKLIIMLMIILLMIINRLVHPDRITELSISPHPASVIMNDNQIYFAGRMSVSQVKYFFSGEDTNKIKRTHKKGGNRETN